MNINIPLLRADIADRLDNETILGGLPEAIRQKLTSTKRITQAMNQAFSMFIVGADLSSIPALLVNTELLPDESVGDANDGVVGNVTTYLWPEDAFTAREEGGLIKMILDGEEKYYDAMINTGLESLRFQSNNSLYGSSQKIFHVDVSGRRIYAPKDTTIAVRIIQNPEQITDEDTYGDTVDAPEELPVHEVYRKTISDIAIRELKSMANSAVEGVQKQEIENEEEG